MTTWTTSILVVVVVVTLLGGVCRCSGKGENICAFYENEFSYGLANTANAARSSGSTVQGLVQGGVVLPDNHTIRCPQSTASCFTLWDDSTASRVVKQGCWEHPGDETSCDSSICAAREAPGVSKQGKVPHFCCCVGSRCNENFTKIYVNPPTTPSVQEIIYRRANHIDKRHTAVFALVPVLLVAVTVALLYLLWRLWWRSRKLPQTLLLEPAPSSGPSSSPPPPFFDLDSLDLLDVLDKGRYGKVWKGQLQKIEVAVKIYQPAHRQYYQKRKKYRLRLCVDTTA